MEVLSRREFLKLAGVASSATLLGAGLGGVPAACSGDGETTVTASSDATSLRTETSISADAEQGREVKIGFVSPQTGALASFGVADLYCFERAQEAVAEGVIAADGKRYAVTILMADSESDPNRAAQACADLIDQQGADIITAASTAANVIPAADRAEALQTPCLTSGCPWQRYMVGRGAAFTDVFKWTYHTFWGVEDAIATFTGMWNGVATNRTVGVMWPADDDGDGWMSDWAEAWDDLILRPVVPGSFQSPTEDFTIQISEFKAEGCEIGVGIFTPQDFLIFWTQCRQQGWKPKVASYSRSIRFPDAVAALGPAAENLTTELSWHPVYPYTSSLLGETCRQFANEFTLRNGQQWVQPLLHFIVFEIAVDAVKRAADLEDKATILEAVRTSRLETVGGLIDFTEPVAGTVKPYRVGPCHIVENVYKTPQTGGQWRKDGSYPWELVLVSTAACPEEGIEVQDQVRSLR